MKPNRNYNITNFTCVMPTIKSAEAKKTFLCKCCSYSAVFGAKREVLRLRKKGKKKKRRYGLERPPLAECYK